MKIFKPKYRIVETHTPTCGILYYAQVKEWWSFRWEGVYSTWPRDNTYEDQLREIEWDKQRRIPPEKLKTINHYIK
jgi:hypothetical protein